MADSFVEGMQEHVSAAGKRGGVSEILPKSEGDFREDDAAPSAASVFHIVFVAVC